MAGPSKDAVAVVVGEGFDPDTVEEGGGADAVAVGVGEGDAAHGTEACVVEGLESAQEVLAQAPDLAVVQQDGEYQGYVDPALYLEAGGRGPCWRRRSPGALQRLPMPREAK